MPQGIPIPRFSVLVRPCDLRPVSQAKRGEHERNLQFTERGLRTASVLANQTRTQP